MKLLPLCHRHQQRPRQIPCSWRSARDSADSQRCGRWRASSDSASRTRAFGAGEFVPWELNHAKIWGFYWDWLGKWWSGWWCTYPSEKYELVSWDYEIPNLWKNKIHVPNHQPVIYSNKIDFTGGWVDFWWFFRIKWWNIGKTRILRSGDRLFSDKARWKSLKLEWSWDCLGSSMGISREFITTKATIWGVVINCWLVVRTPLKNMKVSWDDYSQYTYIYIWKNKIHVPNH